MAPRSSAPASPNARLVALVGAAALAAVLLWGPHACAAPPGTSKSMEEPSLWDQYKWPVVGVAALCVVQALLIVGLLVQGAHRRRAERQFRQMLEGAPNGMLMVGRDGNIVLANVQMEKLFGYPKAELLGRPVDMLVPDRFRSRHPAHRASFFASPAVRHMGPGRELFGLRKDGTEFPVEIGLSPVQTDPGLFVLVSINDMTERRRAEEGLKKSQRELRLLTGRLLRAQEMERRRIARELHDDLSQNLALLSVEMELLGQSSQAANGDARRMQDLSDRVKQLATSVHDLSRQLHPTKLEQLGLAPALRSLCDELGNVHGLRIDFSPGAPAGRVSEDAALCLYRIVQEALRNIIKHSGARRAAVELGGAADAVELRIADDGTGFDPRLADGKGGLGLVSMRERLRLVGGTIAIDSQPGAGTRVSVRVPVGGGGPAEGKPPAQPTVVGEVDSHLQRGRI
jgi:PAS domain S-box-containing protein